MMNDVIWWAGVATLGTAAAVGTAAGLGIVSLVATQLATHYAKRFGNVAHNLRDMCAWVENGKPQWEWFGNTAHLVPKDSAADLMEAWRICKDLAENDPDAIADGGVRLVDGLKKDAERLMKPLWSPLDAEHEE